MSKAELGLRFYTEGGNETERQLDSIAAKTKATEAATQGLERAHKSSGGAIAQMIASIERQLGVLVELQRAQQAAGASANQLAAAEKAVAIANEQAAVSATKAATANQNGAAASARATSAAQDMAEEVARVNAALNAEAVATAKAAEAHVRAVQQVRQYSQATADLDGHVLAYLEHQKKLAPANDNAVKGSKALQQATLNLGRQFSDIGVSLAGGASPFLVLTQQLPQVADAFAVAKQQGLGFKAVISGIVAEIVPLLVTFAPWIAGLAAVSAGVYLLIKAHKDHIKRIEDLNAKIDEMHKKLADTVPSLNALTNETNLASEGSRTFADWLDKKAKGMANYAEETRKATLNLLNQQAIEAQANASALRAENTRKTARGIVYTGPGDGPFGLFGGVNSKKYKEYVEQQAKADATAATAAELLAKAMAAPNDAFVKQAGAAKGASSAVRDHTKAITANAAETTALGDDVLQFVSALEKQNATAGLSQEAIKRLEIATAAANAPTQEMRDRVLAAGAAWEEHNRVATEAAEVQSRVKSAANDNIRTMQEQIGTTVRFSSTLEKMAYDLEDAADMSRRLGYDIDDIARAINDNDWTSALAGLARVLSQVEIAWKSAATAKEKYNAAASVAGAIGGAIGGTTGSAISGAAAGAQLGTMIAPGIGTAIGAVLGGIGGIFGSSSAKKRQREQEAAQRAAEEAQRQQTIADTGRSLEIALLRAQGNELAAVAKEREDELSKLAALSPALAEQQKAVYAALDLAEAQAKAAEQTQTQIGLMRQLQAMDDAVNGTTVALQANRADELAKLDATSQELQKLIWAREDEGKIIEANAQAAKERADIEAANMATNIGLQRQLMAMDDAVLGTNVVLLAQRADELAKLDDTGKALQKLLWAREDEAAAMKLQADRQSALADLYDAQGRTAEATALRRAQALAAITDPLQRQYQEQTYAAMDAAEAVTAARSDLTDAYGREKSAIEATKSKLVDLVKTLRDYSGSLSSQALDALDPRARTDATFAAFKDIAARSKLGDSEAAAKIPQLGEEFRSALEASSSSQIEYLRGLSYIRRATEEAADTAERQVSAADRQLEALNASVAGLITVNDSVISVQQAIAELTMALMTAKGAGVASVGGSDLGLGGALSTDPKSATGYNAQMAYLLTHGMAGAAGGGDPAYVALGNAYKPSFGDVANVYGVAEALRQQQAGLVKFATGGVFTNGIVSQPTTFDMAQMGEAGPEAIVPLVRGPEGLGVRMSGGSNDNSELIAEVRALRQEVAQLRQDQRIGDVAIAKAVNNPQWAETWELDGQPPERAA